MHEDARIDFFAFEAVADEAAVADADRVGSGSVEGAPAVLAALVASRIAVDDYERGGGDTITCLFVFNVVFYGANSYLF